MNTLKVNDIVVVSKNILPRKIAGSVCKVIEIDGDFARIEASNGNAIRGAHYTDLTPANDAQKARFIADSKVDFRLGEIVSMPNTRNIDANTKFVIIGYGKKLIDTFNVIELGGNDKDRHFVNIPKQQLAKVKNA